ncbi:MAG: glutamate 5-kinase [Nitrososphaerota archaeon]|nr:glutamate 5-kinase [Nitrososphaerota archaeon]MDG7049098.1 glutamate 5-kinase [Nitrososphaerota archaeon]MDG7051311.1 glutamate 5-kinase [Nitrososphaerota archaeon]
MSRKVVTKDIVVVKVGTAVLTENGRISASLIESVSSQISELMPTRSFIIVSSGAILAGISKIGLTLSPQELDLTTKQMCAAVGQPWLMSLYSDAFAKRNIITAQILLTENDLGNKYEYQNFWRTLRALIVNNIVPIINENDVVSTRELMPVNPYVPDYVRFGDNDRLSAIIATKVRAKSLIILTDVDGYISNGSVMKEIADIRNELKATKDKPNRFGRGGMKSKLEAAGIASKHKTTTYIVNGRRPGIIRNVLSGEYTGTAVFPKGSSTR